MVSLVPRSCEERKTWTQRQDKKKPHEIDKDLDFPGHFRVRRGMLSYVSWYSSVPAFRHAELILRWKPTWVKFFSGKGPTF